MRHAFRVGPQQLSTGPLFLYCVAGAEGVHPVFASNDDEGLVKLEALPGKARLTWEPALAEAAARHRLPCEPLPDYAVQMKAELTLHFHHGPLFDRTIPPPVLSDFLIASAEFFDLAPWDVLPADEPLDLQTEGATRAELEGCVIGQEREQLGLALYFSKGAVDFLTQSVDRGDPGAAASLESLSLLFETEPSPEARAALAPTRSCPQVRPIEGDHQCLKKNPLPR